jgi:uncharacterized protein
VGLTVSPDFSKDLLSESIFFMNLALLVDDRIEPSPFRPEDFNTDNPLVNEISASGIAISYQLLSTNHQLPAMNYEL